jgi:hypothetical protein
MSQRFSAAADGMRAASGPLLIKWLLQGHSRPAAGYAVGEG